LELPHYVTGYGTADETITGAAWPGGYAEVDEDGPVRGLVHAQDWRAVRREPGEDLGGLPLPALLSQALVAFVIDYENRRAGPYAFAANVFPRFTDDGLALDAVPTIFGITGEFRCVLERHGMVRVSGIGSGEPWVHLTAYGRRLRDAYHPLVAEISARWAEGYGGGTITALATALARVAANLEPGLPAYPVVRFVQPHGFVELGAIA
jgi:hypothetical protein